MSAYLPINGHWSQTSQILARSRFDNCYLLFRLSPALQCIVQRCTHKRCDSVQKYPWTGQVSAWAFFSGVKSFYYYALYPGMCSIWLIYSWVVPSSPKTQPCHIAIYTKGKLSNTLLGYLFQALTDLVRRIFQGASLHFPVLNLVIGTSAICMCSPWLLHRSATINQPSITVMELQ